MKLLLIKIGIITQKKVGGIADG